LPLTDEDDIIQKILADKEYRKKRRQKLRALRENKKAQTLESDISSDASLNHGGGAQSDDSAADLNI